MFNEVLEHLVTSLGLSNSCDLDTLVGFCPAVPPVKCRYNNHHFDKFFQAMSSLNPRSYELGRYPVDDRSRDSLLALVDVIVLRPELVPDFLPRVLYFFLGMFLCLQPRGMSCVQSENEQFSKKLTTKLISVANSVPSASPYISATVVQTLAMAEDLLSQSIPSSSIQSDTTSHVLWPYLLEGFLEALWSASCPFDVTTATDAKDLLFRLSEGNFSRLEAWPQFRDKRFLGVVLGGYLKGALSSLFKNHVDVFTVPETKQILSKGKRWLVYASKPSQKRNQFLRAFPDHFIRMNEYSIDVGLSGSRSLRKNPQEILALVSQLIYQSFSNKKTIPKDSSAACVSNMSESLLPTCNSPSEPVVSDNHQFDKDFAFILCSSCCLGFERAALVFPELIPSIAQTLYSFIFSDEFQVTPSTDHLKSILSGSLARVLKTEFELCGRDFVSTTTRRYILKLEELLQRRNGASQDIEKNTLILLGRITSEVDSSDVADQVIQILFQKFQSSSKLVHLIISNLATIALEGDDTHFSLIVTLFVENYRKPLSQVNRWSMVEIRNALSRIAAFLSTDSQKLIFSQRMLELLTGLGMTIQQEIAKTGELQIGSHTGHMGFLLPTVATLIRPSSNFADHVAIFLSNTAPPMGAPIFTPDSQNVMNFRSIWFLLVLYNFVDEEKNLLPEWYAAVRSIASSTPPLISKKTQYISLDHEAQGILKAGGVTASAKEGSLLKSFQTIFSDTGFTLSFAQVLYLLMVYHLETIRSESGTFHTIFLYFEDPNTLQSGLGPYISVIANVAFQNYLIVMESSEYCKNSSRKQSNIINHTIFLLVKSCSHNKLVRKDALKFLDLLSQRYSFVKWNRFCISVLFDLIRATKQKIQLIDFLPNLSEINGPLLVFTLPSLIGVELNCVELHLPLHGRDIEEIFTCFTGIARTWMDSAAKLVPTETMSALQEYLQTLAVISDSKVPNFGCSLGLEFGLAEFHSLRGSLLLDHGATIAVSSSIRQRYLGEISGLYEAHLALGDDDAPFGMYMSNSLQASMKKILLLGTANDVEFRHCLLRSAALVVWSAHEHNSGISKKHRHINLKELMHIICIGPARIFTPSAITAGICAWRWIFSVSYDLSVSLFVNMRSAWAFTVDNRMGIFSNCPGDNLLTGDYPCALFTAKHNKESTHSRVSIQPHLLWISFFVDLYDVIRHNNTVCLRSLTMMLNKALGNPQFILTTPSSFGCRFKMFVLGLKLIDAKGFEAFELLELLRDRVYAASFHWFFEAPRWITSLSAEEVSDNTSLIIAMCKSLHEEMFQRKVRVDMLSPYQIPVTGINDDLQTLTSNRSEKATHSVKFALKHDSKASRSEYHDVNWIRTWELLNDLAGASSDYTSSPKLKFLSSQYAYSTVSSIGDNSRRFKSHRDLLVSLLSHELHRMSAWYNPAKSSSLGVEDQELFIDRFALANDLDWEALFSMSWEIDPKLGFRLAQRFPSIARLQELLRESMRRYPWSLFEIGDSVIYLVTPANLKNNPAILSHLAFYQPCSLPTALKFLKVPYSKNRTVAEYTMRSLESHDPDGVIFYLSQILQALRFDFFGLLRVWLLQSCSRSPYLAHQLIWACQTESVVDTSSPRGTDLTGESDPTPSIAIRLLQEIIESFSLEHLKFYNAEFKFFGEITNLSKELLDIPKQDKDMRNAELRRRLAAIEFTADNLYIPTDHNAIVEALVPSSGVTLQSAAKVPFLVVFNVLKRIATTDMMAQQHGVDGCRSFKQAVIFKAGDDIRQDALALQVIRLIKDVVGGVGLDLFLYPYKVVPTRSGDDLDLGGVIECVPYARSRDELGKANNRTLKQIFIARYGNEEGDEYRIAQRNFIVSLAGYAVATYILQVKDRHNGNIMIDNFGHLIHIDFGFIISITPGKDIGFEMAGFKFTSEMAELMDGFGSDTYLWFQNLVVQGFLAVRDHADDIYNVIDLFMDSALGCFKSNSMDNLRKRFFLDRTERAAAAEIIAMVRRAHNHSNTKIYDQIQWSTQGVWYGGQEQE